MTYVAVKIMFFLSATGAVSSTVVIPLSTCVDSPVRTASSVLSSTDSISRLSAGTRSPASRSTMSPGTTSFAGVITSFPSLISRACGAVSLRMASIAFSERYSWMKPTIELRITMAAIVRASVASPTRNEMAVAISSMITKMSLNWFRKICKGVVLLASFSSLGPYFSKRCLTSWSFKPKGSVWSSSRTVSIFLECQALLTVIHACSELVVLAWFLLKGFFSHCSALRLCQRALRLSWTVIYREMMESFLCSIIATIIIVMEE